MVLVQTSVLKVGQPTENELNAKSHSFTSVGMTETYRKVDTLLNTLSLIVIPPNSLQTLDFLQRSQRKTKS